MLSARELVDPGPSPVHDGYFELVIVPGLKDSGRRYWQTLWQERFPACRRVLQSDWNTPDLLAWAQVLAETCGRARKPLLLVAHSFGCLALARAVTTLGARMAGALLVAPADPDKFNVGALLPHKPFAFPSIMVGSDNDLWMRIDRTHYWARLWGSQLVTIPGAGHINTESGFGPWDQGLELLDRLAWDALLHCRSQTAI